MNRVFISGGITGVENYKEKFDNAEKELKIKGYKVINPTIVSEQLIEAEVTWEECMSVTQALFDICDSVYMLRGWEKSAGAAVEHRIALEQNKTIIYE
jgi:hypothetical protein